MSKKNPKTNLLDHSKAKVELLSEYLTRYLNIISNDGYTVGIEYYDLFCGPGVYENGGIGSPIVVLEAIRQFRTSQDNHTFIISCHFNDIDTKKLANLKKNITDKFSDISALAEVSFSSEDYQSELNRISVSLPRLSNRKAFIFIDPYGYKQIKISDIKKLIDSGKSEVLLFLPIQFMHRFLINESPTSLSDFMDELVDESGLPEPKSAIEFIDDLRELFRKKLGHGKFVDTFLIIKDPHTVFSLFFFCSHIKGFEKMLESKWKIDSEQGRGWDYKGQGLFSEVGSNPLEQKLISFLREKERSNGEIYQYILEIGYLPKHAKEVLDVLARNGQLKIKGTRPREGVYYISYRDFKDHFNRITISLK